MTQHAILAPSSAARRMQCPGSRALCVKYPEDPDSPHAKEGTLAHEVLAATLLQQPIPPGATDEMLDGAEMFQDAVAALMGNRTLPLHVEETVMMPAIHPECWGTPDVWFEADDAVHVIDYKFGHKFVDAFENWQLLEYAAGVVTQLGLESEGRKKLCLTIVQPRNYHRDGPVRTWELTILQARDYWTRLCDSESLSMREDAPCHTGRECAHCSAACACITLQQAAYHSADFRGFNHTLDLDNKALGRELEWLQAAKQIIDMRTSALEDEILALIRAGESIPGWRTEQGSGREKWAQPVEEVLALGQMMGIDISKPGVLTPKQAVKKGLPAAVVAGYSTTPQGEVKLVKDDLRRSQQVFSQP